MPANFKTRAIDDRHFKLSQYAFGPYWLMEAMPWLLLATTMRFLSYYPLPIVQVAAMVLESFAIFLAILTAIRRLTEFSGSQMTMADWSLAKQLNLARDIVLRIYLLLFAVAFAVFSIGGYYEAINLLFALDGIAFDQGFLLGRIWSSVLVSIILMMVVNVEKTGSSAIISAIKELAQRWPWMVPAIVAVAVLQIGLSYVQGVARGALYQFGQTSAVQFVKNAVFFLFVFGFASIRLWATLMILTFALSKSDRRNAATPPERTTWE